MPLGGGNWAGAREAGTPDPVEHDPTVVCQFSTAAAYNKAMLADLRQKYQGTLNAADLQGVLDSWMRSRSITQTQYADMCGPRDTIRKDKDLGVFVPSPVLGGTTSSVDITAQQLAAAEAKLETLKQKLEQETILLIGSGGVGGVDVVAQAKAVEDAKLAEAEARLEEAEAKIALLDAVKDSSSTSGADITADVELDVVGAEIDEAREEAEVDKAVALAEIQQLEITRAKKAQGAQAAQRKRLLYVGGAVALVAGAGLGIYYLLRGGPKSSLARRRR